MHVCRPTSSFSRYRYVGLRLAQPRMFFCCARGTLNRCCSRGREMRRWPCIRILGLGEHGVVCRPGRRRMRGWHAVHTESRRNFTAQPTGGVFIMCVRELGGRRGRCFAARGFHNSHWPGFARAPLCRRGSRSSLTVFAPVRRYASPKLLGWRTPCAASQRPPNMRRRRLARRSSAGYVYGVFAFEIALARWEVCYAAAR